MCNHVLGNKRLPRQRDALDTKAQQHLKLQI
jgi:hypothetical protein